MENRLILCEPALKNFG
ncbi:hypothetical protein BDFB_008200, partial [Asbolus verrucosus]